MMVIMKHPRAATPPWACTPPGQVTPRQVDHTQSGQPTPPQHKAGTTNTVQVHPPAGTPPRHVHSQAGTPQPPPGRYTPWPGA